MATRTSPRKAASARGTLSTPVLVSRALEIADHEGLEALTIRRLALDHGATPMAMYWHFADKEALLGALAERILAEVDLDAVGDDGSWDVRLERFLQAFLAAVRPHPAVADLLRRRILLSEAGMLVAEKGLGLLTEGGFDTDQAAEIGHYVLFAVVTLVTAEPGPSVTVDDRAAEVRGRQAALASLDPDRFPHLIASAAALADCRNEETYYRQGVDVLIEGIRAIALTLNSV